MVRKYSVDHIFLCAQIVHFVSLFVFCVFECVDEDESFDDSHNMTGTSDISAQESNDGTVADTPNDVSNVVGSANTSAVANNDGSILNASNDGNNVVGPANSSVVANIDGLETPNDIIGLFLFNYISCTDAHNVQFKTDTIFFSDSSNGAVGDDSLIYVDSYMANISIGVQNGNY